MQSYGAKATRNTQTAQYGCYQLLDRLRNIQ